MYVYVRVSICLWKLCGWVIWRTGFRDACSVSIFIMQVIACVHLNRCTYTHFKQLNTFTYSHFKRTHASGAPECVCVYMCVCVCVYIYIYIYMIHTCMQSMVVGESEAHTHTYMYIRENLHACSIHRNAHEHAWTYKHVTQGRIVCIRIHTYIHACMYASTQTRLTCIESRYM
jgi:hypothetical protein